MTLPRPMAGLAAPHFRGMQTQMQPPIIHPRAQTQFAQSPPVKTNPARYDVPAQNSVQLNQLKAARQAAQRKYEQCMAKIRQIERNNILQQRKAEQNTTRTLSRSTDSISSLYNEILQLRNQSNLFKRKLTNTKAALDQTRQGGLSVILAPITEGFRSFGYEFDRATTNIDSLFGNIATRIKNLKVSLESVEKVPSIIAELEPEITELDHVHKLNTESLEQTKKDIEEMITQNRDEMVGKLRDRMRKLSINIESLDKKSRAALDQSQSVVADTQNTQFEFRQTFDKSLEKTMKRFRERLSGIKQEISALRNQRFSSLDAVHTRIAQESEQMAKRKRKRQKEAQKDNKNARISRQEEIDELERRVQKLRRKLAEKRNTGGQQQVQFMQPYYRFKDDGKVDVILVMDDGTVFA